MPFVPCICTNCGAALTVDDTKEAAVCKYCGTAFITEKAINNYKTVNITMEAKDEKALIHQGIKMVETPYFDKDALRKLTQELSDISVNDFYPELFLFATDDKDNQDWLLKNADVEGRKLLALVCFNGIIRDYNKESFDDIKLNIIKNYTDLNFDIIDHDKTCKCVNTLAKLQDVFDEEMKTNFAHLKDMAKVELEEMVGNISDIKTAITASGFTKGFGAILSDDVKALVEEKVKAYARVAKASDIEDLYHLSKMVEDDSIFRYQIAEEMIVTSKSLIYKGREYPSSYAHEYTTDDTYVYLLLQLDETEATIIRASTSNFTFKYKMFLPNLDKAVPSFFANLLSYKTSHIEGSSLKLVYKEGISYKKSLFEKMVGILNSILK